AFDQCCGYEFRRPAPGTLKYAIHDLLLEIRGQFIWILVLVEFDFGVKVLEGVRGEPADLRLYDGGWQWISHVHSVLQHLQTSRSFLQTVQDRDPSIERCSCASENRAHLMAKRTARCGSSAVRGSGQRNNRLRRSGHS